MLPNGSVEDVCGRGEEQPADEWYIWCLENDHFAVFVFEKSRDEIPESCHVLIVR